MWPNQLKNYGFSLLFIGLFLACQVLVPSLASAQEWTWTTSQIDAEGTDSWLAVDHDGNIHVSYHAKIGGQLRYGFLPAGGSHWFTMTLDQMLGDFLTRIAVDPQGNPYVCYTPGIIKLASFDGHRWNTQQIDPGSGLVSYYCSIAIGQDGVPQLSWYVEAGFMLRYAILQDGIWVARTIDTKDAPGKFNSMALDKAGRPQVSYIGLFGTKLKYARFDGKEWIHSDLEAPNHAFAESRGDTGMGTSIIVDSLGNPMISYFDTSSLKLAHLVEGKWKFEVIDKFAKLDQWGWRNFRTTILLDQKGNPHIGYQGPLGLKHAWWDGTRWRTQLIIAPSGTTFDGAMGMDSHGNLYFCYTDPRNRTLQLAIGRLGQPSETAKSGTKEPSTN